MSDNYWVGVSASLRGPHLRWIGREPLSFALPTGCTRVRLHADNPVPMPMHIAAAHFFDATGRCLPQGVQVLASSWWSDSVASVAEQCEAFLEKPYGCGIHTEAEQHPWIDIRMDALEQPLLMVLFNRSDLWAWRNEWLRIHVTLQDGTEHTLFDQRQGAQDWLASLRTEAMHGEPREVVRRLVALDLLQALVLGDPAIGKQPEAPNRLWNHRFESLVSAFEMAHDYRLGQELAVLNQVAALRRLEIGAHGVTRTFRFLSYAVKSALLQRTAELCQVLESLGYRSCLAYGTALGLIRDGDLIAHDDDLDVHAIAPSCPASSDLKSQLHLESAKLCGALRQRGWSAVNLKSHVQVRHEMDFNVFSIDVFPTFERDGDLVSPVNHKGPVSAGPAFEVVTASHGRARLPLPADREAYCRGVYGGDWRTPIAQYHHTWL
jgi:hypothetical protein